MKIVDLTDEYMADYLVCLEDWFQELKEVSPLKEAWYEKMQKRGLRVKLALADDGVAGGMIQYLPIEHSFAQGEDLYFINCIWVHGYNLGRGNFQKRGMGRALLSAAEADAKRLGAKGMAAWGVILPFWMRASWFKKHGYKKADRKGIQALLWKPFTDDARPPRWVKRKKKPHPVPGRVTVTAFINGWCPAQNLVFERARKAAADFGDEVIFEKIDTSEQKTLLEWGIADALFIDDRQIRTGPPPSRDKIKKLIAKKLKKLKT